MSSEEALSSMPSNHAGLTETESANRLKQFGENSIKSNGVNKSLPLNLDHHPGPENNLEPVLVNDNLVDQPPDQLLVIFVDYGRMLPDRNARFSVPLAEALSANVFH